MITASKNCVRLTRPRAHSQYPTGAYIWMLGGVQRSKQQAAMPGSRSLFYGPFELSRRFIHTVNVLFQDELLIVHYIKVNVSISAVTSINNKVYASPTTVLLCSDIALLTNVFKYLCCDLWFIFLYFYSFLCFMT